MKKLLLPLLIALVGFSSCSEDFEVAAPYKQVTVVYGLLDVRGSAQYVRVQKAFMDEARSAFVMAKEDDSSFYQNLRVEMREISGSTVRTLPALQRVDLQAEGFPKESGSFFETASYAYKTTERVQAGRRYRLVITNTETGRVDSSETEVIDSSAAALQIVQVDLFGGYAIDFSRSSLNFGLQFNPFPSQAKMMEAVMRFHVIDRNTNTGNEVEKTYDFTFARLDTTAPDFPRIAAPNSSFYSFLAGALGPAPAGIERILDSSDILIHVGTRDMLRYQIFNSASGGLTGDQVRPLYTNIRSADGSALGLFAARTTRIALNVPINKVVGDSLRANPLTAPLRIVGVR